MATHHSPLTTHHSPGIPRVGIGCDVHRLVPERRLVLGGVEIPAERGLAGHSDADVLAHAVIDALLGAAALGDLGRYFPPGDPAYRDASSLEMLQTVRDLLAAQGYVVENIDATVIAERPRLAPHIPAMRQNLAATLRIAVERVSVKATTTDGLGLTGRGEGMAAQAIAGLRSEA